MSDCSTNTLRLNCWLDSELRAGNAYIWLPQTLPACALAMDDREHGDESHVKEANVLTEHAAVERPSDHPAAQVTAHESESARPLHAGETASGMRSSPHGQGARGKGRIWTSLANVSGEAYIEDKGRGE